MATSKIKAAKAAVSLTPKEQFYAELDKLEADSDHDVDEGRTKSEKFLSLGRKEHSAQAKTASLDSLPRSFSDSHVDQEPNNHATLAASALHASNIMKPPQLATRHTHTGEMLAHPSEVGPISRNGETGNTTGMSGPSRAKRKRNQDSPPPSNNRKLFQGLHFFFFPNNDLNPGRRLRIKKSIEFGATWQRDWSDTVTHVVVDKNIDYSLLIKYLKVTTLPSKVAVVSEDFPADCISYRCVLDPTQRQYRVKSAPVITHQEIDEPPVPEAVTVPQASRLLEVKRTTRAAKRYHDSTSQSTDVLSSPIKPLDPSYADQTASATRTQEKPTLETVAENASFERIIEQARNIQQLPLDDDMEDSDEAKDDYDPILASSRVTRNQNTFQCMHKHTATTSDNLPNKTTIDIFQQMADYYNAIGDEWRTRAYRKAISALRKHPEKVCTREQALKIPQIGERIATKIEEIAFTNRLRRLDAALAEPDDRLVQMFLGIYGVGFNQASKWVAAGYKTLDDLKRDANLTTNQRIGIEHYDDFNARIPRAEVEQIGAVVRKTLEKLDDKTELIIGGSYRRGAESSGDVDCIITHPDLDAAGLRKLVFDRLVPKLTKAKFFVAQLSSSSRNQGSKWLGACQLPKSTTNGTNTNPWRRIDLLITPANELGAALIYFTGNDLFNRSIRLLASTKGMRLNQHGLYKDVMRGKARAKITEGSLVEGRDEKKIFEVLGVPWRPPEHRVC